jgi:putative nucleotidyltransferase with HDIG domain
MKKQNAKPKLVRRQAVTPLPGAKSDSSNGGYFGSEGRIWGILIGLSIIISIFLYPNILTSPQKYRAGDIADHNIKARQEFLVENNELTEKKRAEAVKAVASVYDFDPTGSNLVSRVHDAFATERPFLNKVRQSADDVNKTLDIKPDEALLIKQQFYDFFDIAPDDKFFTSLMKSGFTLEVENAVVDLLAKVLEKGVVSDKKMLMRHSSNGIILHNILTGKEVKLDELTRFYDLKTAQNYITEQQKAFVKTGLSPNLAKVSCTLAGHLVRPNLTFNQRETDIRKDKARKSVNPFFFKVKKSEMLVREGERISPEHLLKINEQNRLIQQNKMLARAPAMAMLISIMLCAMYLVNLMSNKNTATPVRDMLLNAILILFIFLMVVAGNFMAGEIARGFESITHMAFLFAIPVASGAMIICSFLGMRVASGFSLIIAVLASIVLGSRVEFFVYFFITSLIAAYHVKNSRERSVFIKAGIRVGVYSAVLALCVEGVYGTSYTLEALIAIISAFAGGLLIGIITTGIQPLIEMAFGYTTDIKLLELASLDQPLLRELMVQAPGTYHHSVVVSNMVEATAKAVNANPLLAKVAAYYHDIGKIKKPLYFVENQGSSENKHNKLAPSMSSLILISHVKDGVDMAEKNKLGREIFDIIQQHHGTSLISFFYEKAKEHGEKKTGKSVPVKEEDFRYPGPKPQTKEAGLVMLADVVEASSRTLVDPTVSRLQGLVQKIINKIFFDGQLDECELTLRDLHQIARSFNKTLSGIYHHRVEYPEQAAGQGSASKKAENGHPDKIRTTDSRNNKKHSDPKAGGGLKRLGLS